MDVNRTTWESDNPFNKDAQTILLEYYPEREYFCLATLKGSHESPETFDKYACDIINRIVNEPNLYPELNMLLIDNIDAEKIAHEILQTIYTETEYTVEEINLDTHTHSQEGVPR